ncbi:3-deoxy-manno-octulosonate cytidylyltransferase [Solimonas marina]|uniref:3-deoxy-manno-octulosonate cytidylyltransferase n=1 Tax=Solimonas marina TaxID=2714601 RepID=A0A970B6B9_9GAMM|nr:3-deoxy-manno-octulosonate cytidylyltransferase [Solimonas marina]NKF22475.1 3-deoxy-manno-octulosonate cytidylyltransferase [Solimonas marina]
MSDEPAVVAEPFKVVIPARLGSTRLPRKVLREIAGKPVVQHVWEAARKAGADEVIVATDSDEVRVACEAFGADVRLTAPTHNSGTDRANEIARQAGWDASTIVVNLQGDEPMMPPALVAQAAQLLADDPQAHIASLCHPLQSVDEWLNPNVVKLVMDRRGYAMYFSRAPIPWRREGASREQPRLPSGLAFRHIGLYAYRVAALTEFSELSPAPLEDCEALEQLRALTHGFRIRMGITETPPPRGIDTEEDLQAVERLFSAG